MITGPCSETVAYDTGGVIRVDLLSPTAGTYVFEPQVGESYGQGPVMHVHCNLLRDDSLVDSASATIGPSGGCCWSRWAYLYFQTTYYSTEVSQRGPGQAWIIPFASSENTISLDIQNSSSVVARNVSVVFNGMPSWLKFKSTSATIKEIAAQSTWDAEFTFSIDKKAPVGKDTTLMATMSTGDGQSWTKEIKIEVGAPKDYKLYHNFPNPFNPSTKIAFELPKASRVKLIVFDIVGREVAQITDTDYPAGYTEITWNGTTRNGNVASSGVYFYRISADRWNKTMKMVVLK